MLSPARSGKFIVASSRFDSRDLTRMIGIDPDDVRVWKRREPHEHAWEIRVDGTTSTDVSSMIDTVLARLGPAQERLIQLCADEETVYRLRVVLYIEDDSQVRVGPGFAVSSDQIEFLASIRASLDADLYGVDTFDPT